MISEKSRFLSCATFRATVRYAQRLNLSYLSRKVHVLLLDELIFLVRYLIRCLLDWKVSVFLSPCSFHPAFCHSRMPEGSSANLSWTRTSTWTVLRVLGRLIGEHEANGLPICLIFREWKIFKCCRCCFIFYPLARVTLLLLTFPSQTKPVFDKLPVRNFHAKYLEMLSLNDTRQYGTRLTCHILFTSFYYRNIILLRFVKFHTLIL